MKMLLLKDVLRNPEQYQEEPITLCGWVKTLRDSKAFGFIEMNDGTSFNNLQIVFERDKIDNFDDVCRIGTGSSIIVKGNLVLTPEAKQPCELKATEVKLEGGVTPDYPLQKKRHTVEFLRTLPHLRQRTNLLSAVYRVRSLAAFALHKFFNENGYNAYVLQRRVNPYAPVDQVLDLGRAIRYIRYYAEEKGIAKADVMIACGFSAGGANIMSAIARQYGHVTPDTVYPAYVCDEIDAMSADMTIALPIYGLFINDLLGSSGQLDFSANENLPAVFGVIGQKDGLSAMVLPGLAAVSATFPDFSFYLAPDAPHGVGLGTGTRNYVNAFTQFAQWPQMAINFIESRLDLQPKTYDLNQTMNSW